MKELFDEEAAADRASPTQTGEERAAECKECSKLINERDWREEVIDDLCNAVLGVDRHEWSSAYGYANAVEEVEDRMQRLSAPPSPEDDATVRVPRELTAENGAKAALMGEFKVGYESACLECLDMEDADCMTCGGEGLCNSWITIDWTTIKAIYKAAIEHFEGDGE